METEKFELMLDEAQANAALEKGMLYADTFVNKNYLINLDRYPLVELDSAEKSDEYIRLYQIERIVYDVDENANDKLISVYSASDTEEKDHALAMKSLNQGVRLMKTELNSLTAYQLMLKLPNEKIGRRIYVYDISGEMFSSSSDVQNNLAYSYANGFIFIIDPLTLNQFAIYCENA